jgi:TetR/AcrR family transcriptional regulator
MPRPKTDNPETRARILEAAEDLFAGRGLTGTTLREVAERAEVNSALVHYYFGTKEGLYREVLFTVAADVGAMASRVEEEGGTATERLRRYVDGFARFVVMRPDRPRMIMRELIEGAPVLREALAGGFQPVHMRVLRRVVEDGVRTGEFREVDAGLVPLTVLGMMVQFAIARPLISFAVGEVSYDEAFARRVATHVADVLLDGMRPTRRAITDADA